MGGLLLILSGILSILDIFRTKKDKVVFKPLFEFSFPDNLEKPPNPFKTKKERIRWFVDFMSRFMYLNNDWYDWYAVITIPALETAYLSSYDALPIIRKNNIFAIYPSYKYSRFKSVDECIRTFFNYVNGTYQWIYPEKMRLAYLNRTNGKEFLKRLAEAHYGDTIEVYKNKLLSVYEDIKKYAR
ncbi:MAG: hypothetical protein QXO40_00320 [Candidatus Aenigmatarchaeota archaeon]